jgi:hypothetical protein
MARLGALEGGGAAVRVRGLARGFDRWLALSEAGVHARRRAVSAQQPRAVRPPPDVATLRPA